MARIKVVVGKDVCFSTTVWVECEQSEAADKALQQVREADFKGEVDWDGGLDADFYVHEEETEEDEGDKP